MQNILPNAPARQALDVAASLFNPNGLQSAFRRLLKQGSTANGRSFEITSGHGPEGRTLSITAQPAFNERLGLLFRTRAWTDPSAPSFSVIIPPEGGSLILKIRGMQKEDQDTRYDCSTEALLKASVSAIDEKFFDWVLEASHLPQGFKPRAVELPKASP